MVFLFGVLWVERRSFIMKIALLTKYGEKAASTRQRFIQYQPYLNKARIETEFLPLLDDCYLENLYNNGRASRGHIAQRYLSRLRWLLSSPSVDAIWLHCELFPYLPSGFESLVRIPGKPIIFDYDDAIFHNYDSNPSKAIRFFLGQKLCSSIGASRLAFCGNSYLAFYASQFCSKVEIVPTVVDTSKYFPSSLKTNNSGKVNIGWIGTPTTWQSYIQGRLPALIDALSVSDSKLLFMGAGQNIFKNMHIEFYDWSEKAEIPFLQGIDIGIMPLTDTPWARGKCGYKLIQYMACGLPVVASPVGVNSEIVEHGVNGFLAETDAEWCSAIRTLIEDPELRHRMGQAGRQKVEVNYSLQTWGPRVAKLMQSVLGVK
jgi:glycosyltransferase involved in cell wall biosynthesis